MCRNLSRVKSTRVWCRYPAALYEEAARVNLSLVVFGRSTPSLFPHRQPPLGPVETEVV